MAALVSICASILGQLAVLYDITANQRHADGRDRRRQHIQVLLQFRPRGRDDKRDDTDDRRPEAPRIPTTGAAPLSFYPLFYPL